MYNFNLDELVKNLSLGAKFLVVGSKRQIDEEVAQLLKGIDKNNYVYMDDYYFLEEGFINLRELTTSAKGKVEEIKKLNIEFIIICSQRISERLGLKLKREIGCDVFFTKSRNKLDSPIVLIDSGSGAINVLEKLIKILPNENIKVISDTKFMPYGDKDSRIISRRGVSMIKHIKLLDPKLVVLACNTLDAIAGDKLEAQLGGIKLIRIINETTKVSSKITVNKKIALFATPNTVESHKYMSDMLNHTSSVSLLGLSCENLAVAIEKNEDVKEVFSTEIKPLEGLDFDTIILGCTHYSIIMPIIKKKFSTQNIVDSSQVVVDNIVKYISDLSINRKASLGDIEIYNTQYSESYNSFVAKKINEDIKVEIIDI